MSISRDFVSRPTLHQVAEFYDVDVFIAGRRLVEDNSWIWRNTKNVLDELRDARDELSVEEYRTVLGVVADVVAAEIGRLLPDELEDLAA